MTSVFAVAAAVFGISALGTALLRARAVSWGLVDVPNDRSLHSRVMPRGGGIVLVIAALGGLMSLTAITNLAAQAAGVYAIVALMVAIIGWLDDFGSISPLWRFAIHVVAGMAAVATWGVFDRAALPGGFLLSLPSALAWVLTVLWVAGLINAYNFMDGIDGIAAGLAVIGGLGWMAVAAPTVTLFGAAAVLMAAAAAGFLWHNWAPARIFMGDAGSGFLGLSFALFPLMAYHQSGDARIPLVGIVVVAPFLLDTALTFARRLRRRENVLRAHRTHLYQRLVLRGWSHGKVATLYLALGAACALAAIAWLRDVSGIVLIPPLVAVALLPFIVSRVERSRGTAALRSSEIHVE